MALRRIDIANLKSLGTQSGRAHEIPLAPLTLIYGPNSAGKSTIVQALSLVREVALHDGTARGHHLPTQTELFDFGSFRSAIHRHDTSVGLFLGVLLDDAHGGTAYVGLDFQAEKPKPQDSVTRGVLRETVIGSGGHRLRFRLDRRRNTYTLSPGWKEPLIALISEAPQEDDLGVFPILASALRARKQAPRFPLTSGVFPAIAERNVVVDKEANRLFHATVDAVLDSRVRAARRTLRNVSYLGPLRVAPTRLQTLSPEASVDVGISGERTATVLFSDPAVVDRVNTYLAALEIPYELRVDKITVDRADPRHNSVDVSDVVAITLTDSRSVGSTSDGPRVTVSPRDVGFGVSQVLPVVVQCTAARNAVICIEQPEVHIHPRLQGHLMEMFVSSARRNNNQLIIETHSEHLVLRLQRMLRDGYPWLTSDKVSVIYVDVHDDGSAHPLRLPLDNAGEFTEAWPMGFFTERLEELYGNPLKPWA